MSILRIVLICLFVAQSSFAFAETTFTTDGSSNPNDRRHDYRISLLRLALTKTIDTHGPFKLNVLQDKGNTSRVLEDIKDGVYPNYFTSRSVSKERMEQLLAIPFPIALGIVSYRIAIIAANQKKEIEAASSLAELKRFTVVQGMGWLDVKILEHSGFRVSEGTSYEGMFAMVERNHADLFFRGANELLEEWEAHSHLLNLAYDEKFILFYPLPRFFYTTKSNESAAERVFEGLIAAYEDGSLKALWEKHFGHSVAFSRLDKRKLYKIEKGLYQITSPYVF